jgi:hypothetical protein
MSRPRYSQASKRDRAGHLIDVESLLARSKKDWVRITNGASGSAWFAIVSAPVLISTAS